MTITEEELKAIEQRAAAATQGPWRVVRNGLGGSCGVEPVADGCGSLHHRRSGPWEPPVVDPDDEFIAAAREDVPRLVAEVRRLREAVEWERAGVSPLPESNAPPEEK